MVILWWLAPPVVATVLAMLWVSWLGRDGRGEIDPEVAVRRLADAMAKPSRVTPSSSPRAADPRDRSTGVAVRRSTRPTPPSQVPSTGRSPGEPQAPSTGDTRRAS